MVIEIRIKCPHPDGYCYRLPGTGEDWCSWCRNAPDGCYVSRRDMSYGYFFHAVAIAGALEVAHERGFDMGVTNSQTWPCCGC